MQRLIQKHFAAVQTVEHAMQSQPGGTAGFDYLRLFLALGVLTAHAVLQPWIDTPQWVWTTPLGVAHRALLPMFFALSGFLVAGSLVRNTVPRFLALRVIRIAPALAVEVTLSAVLIGATFTRLPLADYLSSPRFRGYFLNIVGDVHFSLPGVFEGRFVNGQLWTLPYEFYCYAALAALALIGLIKQRRLFAILVVMVPMLITVAGFQVSGMQAGPAVPGLSLVTTFLAGVALYLFKDVAPLSRGWLIVSIAASAVTLSDPHLIYLTSLPIAYATVWLGLRKAPKLPLGDLSYGIYLFHFPVQRLIFEESGRTMTWVPLLLLSLPLTLICAYASWRFVEAPMLRRKAPMLAGLDLVSRLVATSLARTRPAARQVSAG